MKGEGGGRRYRIGYGMGGRYGHGYKREKGIAEGRRAGGASRKTQRGRKPLDEFRAAASSRSLNYT